MDQLSTEFLTKQRSGLRITFDPDALRNNRINDHRKVHTGDLAYAGGDP